jgi:hypothetical protein
MALKEAITELIYLQSVLEYLYTNLLNISLTNKTPIILIDNQSAKKLAENPEFHKRTKHIDILYHFIRQSINNHKASLVYINTTEQLANSLTKGLNNNKQKLYIDNIGLRTS